MTITYKTIGTKEKNKALAQFIKAQETDHMLYNVNLDRFKQIRDTYEDKESDYYKKVVAEIPILESRIAEVESILQNSYSQISDADLAIAQAEINAEELAKVSG
jgi:hypothetical protein